jgi:putative membrane protein
MSLKTIVNNNKLLRNIIVAVALVVPVVVTLLRYIPHPEFSESTKDSLYILPMLNAVLNGTTFFLLVFALLAIKKKNIILHQKLMSAAMVLSALFLVSYIAFHYTCPETPYPAEGSVRGLYLFILLTHIILSAAIVPLALYAYARGFAGMVEKHKKIVRFAYPMWLYVTATGVIVYLMISPFYPHSPF